MQGVYHFGVGTLQEWKGIDKLKTEIHWPPERVCTTLQ